VEPEDQWLLGTLAAGVGWLGSGCFALVVGIVVVVVVVVVVIVTTVRVTIVRVTIATICIVIITAIVLIIATQAKPTPQTRGQATTDTAPVEQEVENRHDSTTAV
jgi:nitrate/nitrite transporter NarK